MGAVKTFLERKGHETVDEAWQGPEGIGGIDLGAVDEDGTLVFIDAAVRIGADDFLRPTGRAGCLRRRRRSGSPITAATTAYTPVHFDEMEPPS